MKITQTQIVNYRSILDSRVLELGPITVLNPSHPRWRTACKRPQRARLCAPVTLNATLADESRLLPRASFGCEREGLVSGGW